MRADGIHHITAITADAPGAVDFYARVLGLRLVKKTVNYDDPGVYHLYFGDEDGLPGSILTFFEIPGAAPGRPGAGQFHTIAWRVDDEHALAFWARRLAAERVAAARDGDALAFADPEGMGLRIEVAPGGGGGAAHPEVPAAHALRGFAWVGASSRSPERTRAVLAGALGPAAGEAVRLDPEPAARGVQGAGTIHHVAFAVPDAEHAAWGPWLAGAGLRPTSVLDRTYFRSIYTREPGGLLIEIASAGPGFAVDEAPGALGTALALPGWLEAHRGPIEAHLTPLANPRERLAA